MAHGARTARLLGSAGAVVYRAAKLRANRGADGVVAAYVKALQLRVGKQETELSDYKLYVAERYASKEYLSETKREILDAIRDLARRIEHP